MVNRAVFTMKQSNPSLWQCQLDSDCRAHIKVKVIEKVSLLTSVVSKLVTKISKFNKLT
jgi:hypothetical protein